MKKFFFAALLFLAAPAAFAASVTATPSTVLQGEPVLVTIVTSSTVQSVTWNGEKLPVFNYNGAVHALIGVDINLKPGTYPIQATLSDGTTLDTTFTVAARVKYEAPLGIPESLGGNTTSSARTLVSTLAAENATLLGLRTFPRALWTQPFRVPLNTAIAVTDPYGYSRSTVGQTITHKGTDFRAEVGTRVRAMNKGIVRLVRTYRNYGKTIIIDHGQGVQTMYMHLSRIDVNIGELVQRGQIIGLSGQTGYAEGPHLHTSVRIDEVSIDPASFLGLFGVRVDTAAP